MGLVTPKQTASVSEGSEGSTQGPGSDFDGVACFGGRPACWLRPRFGNMLGGPRGT